MLYNISYYIFKYYRYPPPPVGALGHVQRAIGDLYDVSNFRHDGGALGEASDAPAADAMGLWAMAIYAATGLIHCKGNGPTHRTHRRHDGGAVGDVSDMLGDSRLDRWA